MFELFSIRATKGRGLEKEIMEVGKEYRLNLAMMDRRGIEYCDHDVVRVLFPIEGLRYQMVGVVRYFGGRFEIVCPWADGQRFIMGLNSQHEILGPLTDEWAVHMTELYEQATSKFEKKGGVK